MHDARQIAAAASGMIAKTVHGIITSIDPVNHAAKALVQPEGIESGWLPVAALAAGDIRIARLPNIGEHVLLIPIEGDAEHMQINAFQYDTAVTPPVSPQTSKPAQAGELLIMAGCGAPPSATQTGTSSQSAGGATQNAPWWHMTPQGLFSGAGRTTTTMTNAGLVWQVGSVSMTLGPSGLAVTGGTVTSDRDVLAAGISGKSHIHTNGNNGSNTGAPVA